MFIVAHEHPLELVHASYMASLKTDFLCTLISRDYSISGGERKLSSFKVEALINYLCCNFWQAMETSSRLCLNHTVQKNSRGVLGTSFRFGPTSEILEHIQYGGSSVVENWQPKKPFYRQRSVIWRYCWPILRLLWVTKQECLFFIKNALSFRPALSKEIVPLSRTC